jgi:two-component system nitrogen regulation response regulator NtrX
VPALRERREDIPQLVVHFLQQLAARDGLPARGITDDAIRRLQDLEWQGNVRELRNTVERLVILASHAIIGVADVDRLVGRRAAESPVLGGLLDIVTFEEFKQAAERAYLLAKLRTFDWNVSETARALDMPRSNLYKKIERYALQRETGE